MEETKKGTISCKLFGHIFIERIFELYQGATNAYAGQYRNKPTDFCVRCGFRENKITGYQYYNANPHV